MGCLSTSIPVSYTHLDVYKRQDTHFRLLPRHSGSHRFPADRRLPADTLKGYRHNFQTAGYMAVFRSSSPHTIIQKARSEIFHTVLAQVHTHFLHVLPLTDQGRQYTADNAIPVFYKTHKSLQFLTLLFGLLPVSYTHLVIFSVLSVWYSFRIP